MKIKEELKLKIKENKFILVHIHKLKILYKILKFQFQNLMSIQKLKENKNKY